MNRDTHAPLRVMVLGGSGHIGSRWLAQHASRGIGPQAVQAWSASRQAGSAGQVRHLTLDVRDGAQLRAALQDMDAVINAVAGSRDAIALGTQRLCDAALAQGVRLVHLSTQSVYGLFEGTVHESMPLDPRLGWYGQAKCEAENQVRDFVQRGGQAVVLRPGCVGGPASWLWAGRVAQWLRAGRLGDLGAAGDGWSNLVHVDDVCRAISAALQLPLHSQELPCFNMAAPDSPRWNDYFTDLAVALGATPVQRLARRQLWLDSHVASPALKAVQLLARRVRLPALNLPEPMPPGVVKLWAQQMRLDNQAATHRLGLRWTPYAATLADSVRWLQGEQRIGSEAACAR